MARLNNKMKASPKAKTINVAFWGKKKETVTDFNKGVEALKKAKDKGGLMNDSTREAMEWLKNN